MAPTTQSFDRMTHLFSELGLQSSPAGDDCNPQIFTLFDQSSQRTLFSNVNLRYYRTILNKIREKTSVTFVTFNDDNDIRYCKSKGLKI